MSVPIFKNLERICLHKHIQNDHYLVEALKIKDAIGENLYRVKKKSEVAVNYKEIKCFIRGKVRIQQNSSTK